MDVLYPSFLPRVPHEFSEEVDDETWLRLKEEEQHENREAFAKLEAFPKPMGVKDMVEQGDTVELGEDDEDEEELEEDEDDDVGELVEEEEEGIISFSNASNASGDYMEEGDFLIHSTSQSSDLDMSVG